MPNNSPNYESSKNPLFEIAKNVRQAQRQARLEEEQLTHNYILTQFNDVRERLVTSAKLGNFSYAQPAYFTERPIGFWRTPVKYKGNQYTVMTKVVDSLSKQVAIPGLEWSFECPDMMTQWEKFGSELYQEIGKKVPDKEVTHCIVKARWG